jgi:hypothetical protein
VNEREQLIELVERALNGRNGYLESRGECVARTLLSEGGRALLDQLDHYEPIPDPPEYGQMPVSLGRYELKWYEFMHYLYCPVRMPTGSAHVDLRLPPALVFAAELVYAAIEDAREHGFDDPYIYVTARRGYATPDNPLNRPGWHCDGFGTKDLNYVWCDRWGSRYALQPFENIEPGHVESMRSFEKQVDPLRVWISDARTLYRLNPYVVHATPLIPAPGGMRSFLKVSVSNERYNLLGNTHNYAFKYDWKMYQRGEARNDPTYGEADFVKESE